MAEGARLESVFTLTCNAGSNPALSAALKFVQTNKGASYLNKDLRAKIFPSSLFSLKLVYHL